MRSAFSPLRVHDLRGDTGPWGDCRSMQISVPYICICVALADRCRSLSANLCRLVLRVQISILWSGKYDFPLNSFQCDGASWLAYAWVVPTRRVVRDISVLCMEILYQTIYMYISCNTWQMLLRPSSNLGWIQKGFLSENSKYL